MQKKIKISWCTGSLGRNVAYALLLLSGISLISACSGSKFLKEGESFYTGADINFDTDGKRVGRKKILRKELQEYITPKPNPKIFGMRPAVWFYFIAGTPKKEKGLKNFIKNKLGKPPVLITDATPDRTSKSLSGQLNNEGYFKSEVSYEVKTKKKESKVIYNVKLPRPYRLDSIRYPRPRDSVYSSILKLIGEESLLKPGQRYDLERLQAEQSRVEEELENYGFYYFDDRYLIFEADSTVGKRKVNVRLKMEDGIPARAKKIFKIGNVNVYPTYSLTKDTLSTKLTTTKIDGFNYIDTANTFRPEIITRVINLRKGNTYSREDHDFTLSHLMGLGVFKFVNVKFSEARQDSALLTTDMYFTPLKKKSIRAEIQGVSKSNNFVGPGLVLTFRTRNFLRGAELFEVKLNSAYEVQISSQNTDGPLNSFELGLETTLTVPRFISPIRIDYNSREYLPKTVFKVGVNFQNRVNYFRLNSFNVNYGYTWLESISKTHELYPIDITFVQTDKQSDQFRQRLEDDPFLANSFENQFILGTRYSYTLNTQLTKDPLLKFEEEQYKTHNFYFNGNIDVAGNLLYAVQRQINRSGEEPLQIFNAPYSQYVKADVDFRHYLQLDEHNKIVSRLIIGAGYPYKNSRTLPYVKQFSIGGSNSIRAFPARSLGPGTYNVRADTTTGTQFIDQRGDIKLEGNVEYRFDIIKFLKGAVFVDAGNIWQLREDQVDPVENPNYIAREGVKFNGQRFLKELAIGTGLGLRFDFSFFVLRFDTAFPLRKPWLTEDPWVGDEINFGSKTWRQENIIFNIAIGYPF